MMAARAVGTGGGPPAEQRWGLPLGAASVSPLAVIGTKVRLDGATSQMTFNARLGPSTTRNSQAAYVDILHGQACHGGSGRRSHAVLLAACLEPRATRHRRSKSRTHARLTDAQALGFVAVLIHMLIDRPSVQARFYVVSILSDSAGLAERTRTLTRSQHTDTRQDGQPGAPLRIGFIRNNAHHAPPARYDGYTPVRKRAHCSPPSRTDIREGGFGAERSDSLLGPASRPYRNASSAIGVASVMCAPRIWS